MIEMTNETILFHMQNKSVGGSVQNVDPTNLDPLMDLLLDPIWTLSEPHLDPLMDPILDPHMDPLFWTTVKSTV